MSVDHPQHAEEDDPGETPLEVIWTSAPEDRKAHERAAQAVVATLLGVNRDTRPRRERR